MSEFSTWQRWKGIMKCYPFEEKRLSKWQPPYFVQPKYDGVRCRAVPLEGSSEYILLSSEENIIFSVPHINKGFRHLFNYAGPGDNRLEFDGELYCHGMSFEEIVSITSRTTNLHPNHQCIQFHCFDVVTHETQMHRLMTIEEFGFKECSSWLQVAPFWIADSLDEIYAVFNKVVALGYEGIIVRHHSNYYERKRSTWVMKFKPKKEDSYEIVDAVEEVDKAGLPKGSLGALVCKSGDGNLFSVGTGFTAESRQIYWEMREQLVGRTARVKYQHITSGRKVPRFPVFVEVID